MADRELLFTLTRNDFKWDAYRGSGPGGQHRNKTSTAVRCRHLPSGAVGQAADSKSQMQNRQQAFQRCVDTKEFQSWLKHETLRRNGELAVIEARIETAVNKAMRPANLLVEVERDGEWVSLDDTTAL